MNDVIKNLISMLLASVLELVKKAIRNKNTSVFGIGGLLACLGSYTNNIDNETALLIIGICQSFTSLLGRDSNK